MNRFNNYRCPAGGRTCDEPSSKQDEGSNKVATATKAIRAITAIVVFGIPLVTGTATLLGYGIYKAYKRITGRS